MISIRCSGQYDKTKSFLNKMTKIVESESILNKYGQLGVNALRSATPVDTGLTSSSWQYKVDKKNGGYVLSWYNTHTINNVNVAIIIQYGHGTRNGGWVEGRDYINPAIQPIFDQMVDSIWKEVIRA